MNEALTRTKILVADDDAVSRRMLEAWIAKWGFDLAMAGNGDQAWSLMQREDHPTLLIVDWVMPGMDGLALCRQVRQTFPEESIYIILLTVRDETGDIVSGLEAGADDYVTKPFEPMELHARIQVGLRMIKLQNCLDARVKELEEALANVKRLQGLLPICSYCKRIRDDQNYWNQVEDYLSDHADVRFTHGICPDCSRRLQARRKDDASRGNVF